MCTVVIAVVFTVVIADSIRLLSDISSDPRTEANVVTGRTAPAPRNLHMHRMALVSAS